MTHARAILVLVLYLHAGFAALQAEERIRVDYSRDIRPLLSRNCYVCHGPDPGTREAGLRLDRADSALAPLESGKTTIVPGNAEASELMRRITSDDPDLRMPPRDSGHTLSKNEIDALRDWISAGAAFDDHWSFRPVQMIEPPAVTAAAWCRNPIDLFILDTLEAHGLQASPEADRPTLLRRLSLDLTGLPPSTEELADFCDDPRSNAYELAVDRLLASPRFGERWGRHWLDLAHYADSDGYLGDALRPHAWRYRDWVINAINRDLPFDQFTVEQLAGDLLPGATIAQKTATGFLRNTLRNTEAGVDLEEYRLKEIVDRVSTIGAGWLGLSLGCAECHAHKYDPISQREFYQLFAFFNDADDVDIPLEAIEQTPAETADADAAPKSADAADAPVKASRPEAKVMTVASRKKNPRTSYVHLRGDYRSRGEDVSPDTPAVLPPLRPRRQLADRLDFAGWLVDPANPLTARVTVNNCWKHLFGQGLVATVDNFGLGGDLPSHPELLDWLAGEFTQRGWSRKELIRLIVCSATYRQRSEAREDLREVDPLNRLLARQTRLRLEAETIRDAALFCSGLVDLKIGGPGIRPPQPGYVTSISRNAAWEVTTGGDLYRRGTYIVLRRATPYPMLMTFDAPDSTIACTRRERSNSPLQALTLLNDPVFFECAQALGHALATSAEASVQQRLVDGFRRCLSREPSALELQRLMHLHAEQSARLRADPEMAQAIAKRLAHPQASDLWKAEQADQAAHADVAEEATWVVIARVLMNVDEFITRE